MNKNGQTVIYGFMLGLVILIVALAIAPAVVEQTQRTMNQTSGDNVGLSCNNETISNFDKAACYATDLTPFYFIGILLFIAGIIVTAKIVFGGEE